MRTAKSTGVLLTTASLAITFAAMMIAMWSLSHERLAWGAYNAAIAAVAFIVMVLVRARNGDA